MISAAVRAPPTQAVMEARGLTRVYHMGSVEVPALRAVDLDLYAGELVILLGASGSGKSTLLNLLGGLDVPTGGSIHFCGHDLTAAGDRELTRFRREHVGFVFQFYNLIPSLTALENVALVTDISAAPMDPTTAVITHNAAIAAMGDRVLHMSSGRIASQTRNAERVSPSALEW